MRHSGASSLSRSAVTTDTSRSFAKPQGIVSGNERTFHCGDCRLPTFRNGYTFPPPSFTSRSTRPSAFKSTALGGRSRLKETHPLWGMIARKLWIYFRANIRIVCEKIAFTGKWLAMDTGPEPGSCHHVRKSVVIEIMNKRSCCPDSINGLPVGLNGWAQRASECPPRRARFRQTKRSSRWCNRP